MSLRDYAAETRDDAPAAPAGRGKSRPLPIEWAGSVQPVIEGLWLVEDWLPAHGVAAIYGHPGSGKSFLAMDMGLRIAMAWMIAGRAVTQGLVLYVCAEGQTGFRNRLAAFREVHDVPADVPFAFVPIAIDLQAPGGDKQLLIEAIATAAQHAGQSPALVVIDTLSKTFGAGKENTDDMATYVANCAAVADHFTCCTLIVHHRPKDSESRDLRGHSSLRGGVEAAILVEGGSVKSAETIKQKDGPDGERIAFTLSVVELGTNSKGKAVTSCVVEYREATAATEKDTLARKVSCLSDQQRLVYTAIGDAIAEHGVPIGEPIPEADYNAFTTGKMIEAGHVADRCRAALQAVVAGSPDKMADNIDRAKRRAVASLKAKGIVGSWADWLWINY